MAAIHDTAYPRLKYNLTQKEISRAYTPVDGDFSNFFSAIFRANRGPQMQDVRHRQSSGHKGQDIECVYR